MLYIALAGLLGAVTGILGIYLTFRVGWVEPPGRSPGARQAHDHLAARVERVWNGHLEIREKVAALGTRMAELEHRMQLLDHEWTDHYEKSTALENRLKARQQRLDRAEEEDELEEQWRAHPQPAPPEPSEREQEQDLSTAAKVFMARQRRGRSA